jgi:glyoxylase-like metal-dependent hydrolase (beta-lactamase superfamily II)
MPQVTRLSKFGFVNCYLVDEEDGFTLVDTMLPRSAAKILERAAQLGKPIVRIALTHAHGDHIGSVEELAPQLPNAEILISTRDARFLAGDRSLDPAEPVDKLRGAYPKKPLKAQPTRTFAAGERIGSLEVIAAPGHTPGHCAFLDTRDRTLYCGDAYTTFGKVTTTAKKHAPFPLAAMATWHPATEIESARALRALEPSRLAPGHGGVVESPVAAMDAAIARDAPPLA